MKPTKTESDRRTMLTNFPLPAVAYLPGAQSRSSVAELVKPLQETFHPELFANEDTLYGIDLYNGGFYWEAHVYWENVWQNIDRGSDSGWLLLVLIAIASHNLKLRMQNTRSAIKHLRQAGDFLANCRGEHPFANHLKSLIVSAGSDSPGELGKISHFTIKID